MRDPRQEEKEKRWYLHWKKKKKKKKKKSEQSCRKKKIKAALAPLRSAARAPHPAVCAPSPPPPPPPPRLASSTAACWTSLLTSTSSRSQLFGRNVNNTWKRRRRRRRRGDATGKNRGGSLHVREGGPHSTMAIFMTIQLQLWRAGFAFRLFFFFSSQRHSLKVRRETLPACWFVFSFPVSILVIQMVTSTFSSQQSYSEVKSVAAPGSEGPGANTINRAPPLYGG